jgi:hypothetical protein
MSGYWLRATRLFSGHPQTDDYLAVYPYGNHYILALEMMLKSPVVITALQAVIGAALVPFTMLFARRTFRSPMVPLALGILVTLWYPLVSYCGYFSSENNYGFFLLLSLYLSGRFVDTGKGALLLGMAMAVGFTIRPQLLLTIVLLVMWLAVRKHHLVGFRWRSLALLLIPVALTVAYSSYRQHNITGRWEIISDNGAVGRFFASTAYKRIVGTRTGPDGKVLRRHDGKPVTRRFQPPATRQLGYKAKFEFVGYIADAEILGKERNRYQSTLAITEKLALLGRNISLLAYHNTMWPQRNQDNSGWRRGLFRFFGGVGKYVLIPLAMLGFIALCFRHNLLLELSALHVITMIYAAAMYFAEIRYRIPYDPILLIFAANAVCFPFKNALRRPLGEMKRYQ